MTLVDSIEGREHRFRALANLICPTGEAWLTSIIRAGAFVAGGAALFVADTEQCIDDVGDIDIWCPVSAATIRDWVVDLLGRVEAVHVIVTRSVCYVKLPLVMLQFIRVEKTPAQVLADFDFDALQVALRAAPAPSMDVCLEFTRYAFSAWRTRFAHRISEQIWAPVSSEVAHRRYDREIKMARKGFSLTDAELPPRHHVCACTRYPRNEIDGRYTDVDALLALPVFDAATYVSRLN